MIAFVDLPRDSSRLRMFTYAPADTLSSHLHGLDEELRNLRAKPLVPRAVPVNVLPGRRDVKVTYREVRSKGK